MDAGSEAPVPYVHLVDRSLISVDVKTLAVAAPPFAALPSSFYQLAIQERELLIALGRLYNSFLPAQWRQRLLIGGTWERPRPRRKGCRKRHSLVVREQLAGA